MNVQLQRPMDSAAFLAWAEGREGRYELANGRVTMMTGGSVGHALVVHGLSAALNARLAGTHWIALTSDLGVKVAAATVRYPDVVGPQARRQTPRIGRHNARFDFRGTFAYVRNQ
jgi:hypothetical protein